MNLRRLLPFGAAAILAVAVGVYLQTQFGVEPYLIWGGSDCEVTYVDGDPVRGCFGYPPVGIFVLFFAAVMVTTFVPTTIRDWWRR